MHQKTNTTSLNSKANAASKAGYAKISRSAVQPINRTNSSNPVHDQRERKKKKGDKTPRQKVEQAVAKRRDEPIVMSPSCKKWLDLLDHPFERANTSCPLSYNPTPTHKTTPVTLHTLSSFVVAPGSCTELLFWPGHTMPSSTDPMDGPAYHGIRQLIGGGTFSPGPQAYAGNPPSAGIITQTLGVGAACTDTSLVISQNIDYDNPSPYPEGASDEGSHLRYRLNAMGIRLFNETVLVNRGGNVRVVQPSEVGLPPTPSNQSSWDQYPTFREYSGTESIIETNWIPRTEDLAMWHHVSTGVTAEVNAAAIRIWVNNPTGYAQNYELQAIYHYEIGGTSVQVVSAPVVAFPSNKNIVEPVLTAMTNTFNGTAKAVATAARITKMWAGGDTPGAVRAAGSALRAIGGSLFAD